MASSPRRLIHEGSRRFRPVLWNGNYTHTLGGVVAEQESYKTLSVGRERARVFGCVYVNVSYSAPYISLYQAFLFIFLFGLFVCFFLQMVFVLSFLSILFSSYDPHFSFLSCLLFLPFSFLLFFLLPPPLPRLLLLLPLPPPLSLPPLPFSPLQLARFPRPPSAPASSPSSVVPRGAVSRRAHLHVGFISRASAPSSPPARLPVFSDYKYTFLLVGFAASAVAVSASFVFPPAAVCAVLFF